MVRDPRDFHTEPLFPDLPEDSPAANRLEQEFWEFHNDNPHVYEHFAFYARYWAEERNRWGQWPISATLVYEYMRERARVVQLSNNHRPYYARLFMRNHPEFNGLFDINRLKYGVESDALLIGDEDNG